jgi:hypothetical protein
MARDYILRLTVSHTNSFVFSVCYSLQKSLPGDGSYRQKFFIFRAEAISTRRRTRNETQSVGVRVTHSTDLNSSLCSFGAGLKTKTLPETANLLFLMGCC